MPKIRRSHQVQDWQSKTHVRSAAGLIAGKQNFNLSEVTPELQLKKMYRKRDKNAKKIKRLIEEKNSAGISQERRAELERNILNRERHYYDSTTRILLMEKKVQQGLNKAKARQDNLEIGMAQAKKNAEKIRPGTFTANDPGRKEFHPELQKKIDTVFPRVPKQRVETIGGKRKLKTKKAKRWSLK